MTQQKTIVITRPDGELFADRLREIGYSVEMLPTFRPAGISLGQHEVALLSELSRFSWVLFTSRNGVRFFPSGINLPAGIRVAAIGERTAGLCVQRFGRPVAFEGGGESSEKFCDEFFRIVGANDTLLLVTAREHRDVIENSARENGISLDKLVVYEIQKLDLDLVILQRLAALNEGEVYWPVFSPSAFRICVETEAACVLLRKGRLLAIGDTTRVAIEEAGFSVYAQAAHPSESGMLELLKQLKET